uniref:Uncharacterized protein n=1 Tax=Ralstonia solanacearum TaxID=305 RepID=A0A0S4WXI5_RALSL|nr:protein of unknown function [Ralstonia solanacearum]
MIREMVTNPARPLEEVGIITRKTK